MSRRGLTLLELLIALSLLVALGAIAFPAVMRTLDGRAFDVGADVAVNHLLLARAHAQSSRQPVEVIYGPDPPHLEARLFEPALAEVEDVALADSVGTEDEEAPVEFAFEYETDEADELVIAEGWAWRALPGGVELSQRPPDETALENDELLDESFDDFMARFEEEYDDEIAAYGAAGDEPVSFRVAVFLPDGSALLADDAWLIGADGRIGRLTVNPFTGLPVFERLEELAFDEEEEPEEDEEEEPEADEETYEPEEEPPAPVETPPAEPEGDVESGDEEEETPG